MSKKTTAWLAFALVAWLGAWTSGWASAQTVGEPIDDAKITTKITAKLASNRDVSMFDIDVDTIDRVVTLRGEVDSDFARDKAARLAKATRGVLSIRNAIRVVPPGTQEDSPGSDTWITAKIKSKLAANPQLNPFDIDIDTEDGRVTLSGKVGSDDARTEAEKLARDTRGVTGVDNEITVTDG